MGKRPRTLPQGASLARTPAELVRDWVEEHVEALEHAAEPMRSDPFDVEALHEFRKAGRRLSAAVQLTELYLTPVAFQKALALTSRLPQGLGACRDADVLAQRLKRLGAGKGERLRTALKDSRPHMPKGQRKKRVRTAARRALPEELHGPLGLVLDEMMARTMDCFAPMRARLRGRAQGISATSSIRSLHAFRLELKTYRYSLEAGRPPRGSQAWHVASQASTVSEILGRVIDASVLASLARTAKPLAARTILAAAQRDMSQARQGFATCWGGKVGAQLRDSFAPA